jgi:hypothetical protein
MSEEDKKITVKKARKIKSDFKKEDKQDIIN